MLYSEESEVLFLIMKYKKILMFIAIIILITVLIFIPLYVVIHQIDENIGNVGITLNGASDVEFEIEIISSIEENKNLELVFQDYPVASEIFIFLKEELQLNDYVCAGILGNMMAETGGQTLNIEWDIGDEYYGICQWSVRYNPEIENASLVGQLWYLKNTIKSEFDTFGYLYGDNFDYEAFTNMKDEREAALAFAICYERCHHDYYTVRQDNAEVAYEYIPSSN